MAEEASKVLEERVRALAEDFDEKMGEALNRIVEGSEGQVESLIERFGAAEVAERMKR